MTSDETVEKICELVARIASIPAPGPNDDIYLAGFASLNALELLVELEDTFGVTLADDQFIAARTPAALAAMVHPPAPEGAS